MMDNQPNEVPGNTLGITPGGIEAKPFSVGAALREARTGLGLGVADVSNRLKFAPRQIEALEEDDFAHLPEMAFVRGFVRSYARLLQLDPVPLLAALPGAVVQAAPATASPQAEVAIPNKHSSRRPNIIWLVAGLAVAATLTLFVWLHGNEPKPSNAPKLPKAETPVSSAAMPAMEASDAEAMKAQKSDATSVRRDAEPLAKPVDANSATKKAAVIRLEFDEESWVEVTDKEGKILLSQTNPPASEHSVNGLPPFSVVIGHTNGVRLYYKGKAVDLTPYTKAQVARLTLE